MKSGIDLVFYNHFSERDTFEMPKGSRPWHMVLLLTEGSFTYRLGKETFQIEKGDAAFFPQSSDFEREVLCPISFHQFGFLVNDGTDYLLPHGGKLSVPSGHVCALCETLDALSSLHLQSSKEQTLGFLSHLLLEHSIYTRRQQTPLCDRDSDVSYVIRYMMEHLEETIRVESLAQELHISRVALLAKFKRVMGCTLSDFLLGLRMKRAKHLLLESNARVNEIASLCGYRNAYYFSAAFKSHTGRTPLEYRREKLNLV